MIPTASVRMIGILVGLLMLAGCGTDATETTATAETSATTEAVECLVLMRDAADASGDVNTSLDSLLGKLRAGEYRSAGRDWERVKSAHGELNSVLLVVENQCPNMPDDGKVISLWEDSKGRLDEIRRLCAATGFDDDYGWNC